MKIRQVLCLEHCFKWIRDLDSNKIGAEVFGELQNVVWEVNGKDKKVRESNQQRSSWNYKIEEDTPKQYPA